MPTLACIVAYANNRVIGQGGGIPWHEPEDLQRFKRITMGHALILGRKNHESIGRPLPGRRSLVLTRSKREFAGCEIAHSLDEAIARARTTDSMPFICGGSEIYRLALPLVTHLYLTEIDLNPAGDAFFPDFDEDDFIEVSRERTGRCTYRTLERAPTMNEQHRDRAPAFTRDRRRTNSQGDTK